MKRAIFFLVVTTFFLAPSDYAFELIPGIGKNPETTFEWDSSAFPIKYSIHQNGTTDVPGNNERNQLTQALTRWNPVSPIKFQSAGVTSTVTAGDLKNAFVFDKQNFSAGSAVLAICEGFFFTNDP
ncbi:hypothetical protein L0222_26290, partial [bacterium]|nr:hypothetical protein [bacterium]